MLRQFNYKSLRISSVLTSLSYDILPINMFNLHTKKNEQFQNILKKKTYMLYVSIYYFISLLLVGTGSYRLI